MRAQLLCAALVLSLPGLCAGTERPPLSSAGEELAALMGVTPLLEQYNGIKGQQTLESLGLRQEITEHVITTSLEVDRTVAEIDTELAEIQEAREFLMARHESFLARTNLVDIILGTGLGVIGDSLEFNKSLENTGSAVGVVSGAISTVLSVVSFSRGGGTWKRGIGAGMLSAFFDHPTGPNSVYPDIVWRYLNTVPADRPIQVTWREHLISEWRKLGRIKMDNSKKAQQHLELLTSSIPDKQKLSMGALGDRSAMLYDVRGRISLMKVGLADVMRSLRSH